MFHVTAYGIHFCTRVQQASQDRYRAERFNALLLTGFTFAWTRSVPLCASLLMMGGTCWAEKIVETYASLLSHAT